LPDGAASERGDARDERLSRALGFARCLAARGEDDAARQAYLDVLRIDTTHFAALTEIGALALASGHRSAARTAWRQAAFCHPDNPAGRVNLGTLLLEDGETETARSHFAAALASDPALPEAHQGMARALTDLGLDAAGHWRLGFSERAVVVRPFRGRGPATRLLLLVAARGGNIPTRHWIDERRFAVTAIYADFYDVARPLPPRDLVMNAIGDADLCAPALLRAKELLVGETAPVLNPPAAVLATGRADMARRVANIPGVVAPATRLLSRHDAVMGDAMRFPMLLRAPGFHTGRHFVRVAHRDGLARAVASLPGDALLEIEYLDARGPDGMARKYRVMFIGGTMYPLHLAISTDWKVHYVTSAMADNAAHRAEEQRFLTDMPGVLGDRATRALRAIGATLALDYAGVDFALRPDGSILVFEANATMVIAEPGPGAIWDYRRDAIALALRASRGLLERGFGDIAP
jgi:Tfp pilus assembly protein PilF